MKADLRISVKGYGPNDMTGNGLTSDGQFRTTPPVLGSRYLRSTPNQVAKQDLVIRLVPIAVPVSDEWNDTKEDVNQQAKNLKAEP